MSESIQDEVNHKLWGEIETPHDTSSSLVIWEREKASIRSKPFAVDGPRLYQQLEPSSSNSDQNASYVFDPYIIHTIKLLQYANKIRALTNQAHSDCLNTDSRHLPPCPLMPPFCGPDIDEKDHLFPKTFLDSEIFRYHMKKTAPEISEAFTYKLSQQSAATICAHAGFDTTSGSIVDFLADLQQEYIMRICKLLRVTVDKKASFGYSSFVNVVEKVFHDVGIGSMTTIDEFYQNRIIKYHDNMMRLCKTLKDEYEKLTNPNFKLQFDDLKTIRITEEPVMEIEFPILDELEENCEVSNPDNVIQLEQLQNIEGESTLKDDEGIEWPNGQTISIKEENLQNSELDIDDEIINVSDSPTTNDIPDIDSKESVFGGTNDVGSPRSRLSHPAKRTKLMQ